MEVILFMAIVAGNVTIVSLFLSYIYQNYFTFTYYLAESFSWYSRDKLNDCWTPRSIHSLFNDPNSSGENGSMSLLSWIIRNNIPASSCWNKSEITIYAVYTHTHECKHTHTHVHTDTDTQTHYMCTNIIHMHHRSHTRKHEGHMHTTYIHTMYFSIIITKWNTKCIHSFNDSSHWLNRVAINDRPKLLTLISCKPILMYNPVYKETINGHSSKQVGLAIGAAYCNNHQIGGSSDNGSYLMT